MPHAALHGRVKWFQSTPPCEGATEGSTPIRSSKPVSIHAPVRGGDMIINSAASRQLSFNPRPRARGRRKSLSSARNNKEVSIHAPVRGGDGRHGRRCRNRLRFNPRPRARGRLKILSRFFVEPMFQSTPPCEGATWQIRSTRCFAGFQSTPPCEGATAIDSVQQL